MNVLVDTSIWSIALRKKTVSMEFISSIQQLTSLIQEGRAKIIGPIRQEILSGITQLSSFKKLKNILDSFQDLVISSEDYIFAAEIYNTCRKKGVHGSHIDFLICSVSIRYKIPVFTLDKDFDHYAECLPGLSLL